MYPHGTSGLGLVLSCARAAANDFGISIFEGGLLGFMVIYYIRVFDIETIVSNRHLSTCIVTLTCGWLIHHMACVCLVMVARLRCQHHLFVTRDHPICVPKYLTKCTRA